MAVSDPNNPSDPNDPAGAFVYTYDANGNVGQLVDLTPTAWDPNDLDAVMVARYEYEPFGRLALDIGDAAAVGPYGGENPFRFSTHQADDATGLLYAKNRYYWPDLGRWTTRDPIGESGAALLLRSLAHSVPLPVRAAIGVQFPNAHSYVGNAPVSSFDVLGFLDPREFWDDWTERQRRGWFAVFGELYGDHLMKSATKHCVPYELLAAIVANEQIDYSSTEALLERLGVGRTVGPAQIDPLTAYRAGCLARPQFLLMRDVGPDDAIRLHYRSYVQSRAGNIDVAACLISKYLPTLCSDTLSGRLSRSFADVVLEQNAGDACCVCEFCRSTWSNGSCAITVGMDVPACVLRAMGAIWNNGPLITSVSDVGTSCPNGVANGATCGQLDDHLRW